MRLHWLNPTFNPTNRYRTIGYNFSIIYFSTTLVLLAINGGYVGDAWVNAVAGSVAASFDESNVVCFVNTLLPFGRVPPVRQPVTQLDWPP